MKYLWPKVRKILVVLLMKKQYCSWVMSDASQWADRQSIGFRAPRLDLFRHEGSQDTPIDNGNKSYFLFSILYP